MYQSSIASALFQSRTRTAVLDLVARQRLSASLSELSRRADLSPRSVRLEVQNLRRAGLVTVERVGGADVVRFDPQHPAAKALLVLLELPAEPRTGEGEVQVRESLAGWGAPLLVDSASRHWSLEETLVRALLLARNDGTVLRVLPALLAARADDVDWTLLKEEARRRKMSAELGAVTELAGQLASRPELAARAKGLKDRRFKGPRYLPEARNDFERRLADERTPHVVRKWGLRMNVSEESFRSTMRRTGA